MILFKSWICTLSHLADIFFDDSGIFKSFDAVLWNDMQTRWLAPDHIFLKPHIPCRIVLASYGTIVAICQEQREQQASQRSLFLCQYSYWALLILARSSGEPTAAFWSNKGSKRCEHPQSTRHHLQGQGVAASEWCPSWW